MTFRYMIRTNEGQLLFAEATSIEDALKQLKLESHQVKRHMPTKWIDKPAMPETVKARLKALTEYRRSLRKGRPKAGGIGKESEDEMKGTLEALQDMREKERPAATKTREPKKEKTVKTATKAKKTKKATPVKAERKAVQPAKEKVAVKKETFSVPDKFVRRFEGEDHTVTKIATGWSIDDGKEHVETLREAMIAILKMHKKEVGHRAASYFFANVEAK